MYRYYAVLIYECGHKSAPKMIQVGNGPTSEQEDGPDVEIPVASNCDACTQSAS